MENKESPRELGYAGALNPQQLEYFMNLIRGYIDKIKKTAIEKGIVGATKTAHQFHDTYLEEHFKAKPGDAAMISCKRGCSFCCHLHVDITDAEAAILAQHVQPEDVAQLEKQKGRGLEQWKASPYAERKCIFLKDSECSVYADRPMKCRKYLVVSKKELCDTEHETHITRNLALMHIEAVDTALFVLNGKPGDTNMADQLLKAVKIKSYDKTTRVSEIIGRKT